AGAAWTVRPAVAERALAASDAVSVCDPAPISVAEKVPWPLVRLESGGSTTPIEVSLLLKCTVPLYEVTGLPWASSAVTLTETAWPAVALAGAVTFRSLTTDEGALTIRLAGAGRTFTASDAGRTGRPAVLR